MLKYIFAVSLATSSLLLFCQDSVSTKKQLFKSLDRKGHLYLYWGWNRSQYSTSNISFEGEGYNFTLHDVKSHDKPSDFNFNTYFNPKYLSIPQYQWRVGYFINDKFSVSFGFNHMKYVVKQNQTTTISGTINTEEAGSYNGDYDNSDITLTEDFLMMEHTDGLNFLAFGLEHIDAFWISKNKKHSLNLTEGLNMGFMYPRSDVSLFGSGKDEWHIAGYGLSANVGVRFDFFKNYFVQFQVDGGFINLPDIITTGELGARARQNFWFFEQMINFGGYIRIKK